VIDSRSCLSDLWDSQSNANTITVQCKVGNCYRTKPNTLHSSNGKVTIAEIYLWQQNTHYFSVFLIESAQHVMLFLWIGSQNDRVFLFGSGSRSAGGNTVIIKRWVCHISSTVMVVKWDVFYCVNGFRVDFCHDRARFVLVAVVALFIVPVFIYFFQKFPNFCAQICGLGITFRLTMLLPSVVQSTAYCHGLVSCYRW